MIFKPENFRRLDENSKPPRPIRLMDNSTLILIKSTGEAMYGRTRSDKDRIEEQFNDEHDLLLWAWVGSYHTDIFLLTAEDMKKHYDYDELTQY